MAEFLGDIAFMVEFLVLGIGLIVIHYGKKEDSKLVKAAGYIMSVASVFALVCTTYFLKKLNITMHYYTNISFDIMFIENTILCSALSKHLI